MQPVVLNYSLHVHFLLPSLHYIFCWDVSVSHQITSSSFCFTFPLFCLIPHSSLRRFSISAIRNGREGVYMWVSILSFIFLLWFFQVRICCLAVSSALFSSACAVFLAVCGSESMLSVCQSTLICCFASCSTLCSVCYFLTHIHTYAYAFVPFSRSFLHIQTQSWIETWTSLE